jgi:hypothetical protein
VLCLDDFGALKYQARLGHPWNREQHPVRSRATCSPAARVRHLLVAADEPATSRLCGPLRATRTWPELRSLLRSLWVRFSEDLILVLDDFSPSHQLELRT